MMGWGVELQIAEVGLSKSVKAEGVRQPGPRVATLARERRQIRGEGAAMHQVHLGWGFWLGLVLLGDNIRANGTFPKWTPPWNVNRIRWYSWTRPLLESAICSNVVFRPLFWQGEKPRGEGVASDWSVGWLRVTSGSELKIIRDIT